MNGAANPVEIGPGCVPPRIEERPKWQVATPAVLLLIVVGLGVVLFFFDPGQYRFYPVCYFHAATGLNCPGCGGQRALHELLHGHFVAAAHANALVLFCLPFVAAASGQWLWRAWRRQPVASIVRPAWMWTFLVLAVIFTVLRNLPAFAWLAP